ncbi:ATP-binding protein [Trichlorobacter ammonificans]|uniref:ATP-binding protein n=1 Tax=Trichlorobacter ammonificans TaxID=2916410 RepID=UPI002737E060|nr:ATP-binding protein [Trichlorobacter ammonificans]
MQRLAHGFPVIAITGPRQSGKTTLARATFPDKPYLSLEDPDVRVIAESDPRRLLAGYPDGAILDEVQRAPHLFSYLQTHVDANLRPGMFVLTGSQQFGLLAGISQSLAGRVGMVQLLPLGINELADASLLPATLDELLFTGGYPALHDRDLLPGDWFAGYVATYVERDVRQLINVRDLSTFQRFLRMCAARTGQLLNLSSLAADCGITHNTAAAWIAVLEASYIIHLLRPHHRNFNKRLVKSPKLYFCDAGLAAWLLGIHKPEDMAFHAQRGNLFETLMVAEFLKQRWNDGRPSNLYFWRDSRGLEVDLLLEEGERLMPVEIKSGTTVAADFTDNLRKWVHLSGNTEQISWLIYGGDQRFDSGTTRILPWGQAGTIGTE